LADRYRLTAFDNRGAGRSPHMPADYTVARMADDAAAVLGTVRVDAAHVMGFSGGGTIAQELALRHPGLVRSLVLISTFARPDAYLRQVAKFLRWLPEVAPDERAMLEAFFLWIYTPRAHASGMVDAIIDEAIEFPHPQSPEDFRHQLDAFMTHDTYDRLSRITVPTLVVAGGVDVLIPPRYGRIVADRIPGAEFVVLPEEAHQPFQEVPEEFNERVDAFWRRVEAG
jgi:pimeloyl-ACP methyl ester carboxylesterase